MYKLCNQFLIGASALCISALSSAEQLDTLKQTSAPKAIGAHAQIGTTTQIGTYAQYVPERLDDFAWENDLVAFRVYGPAVREKSENSGVDAWMKYVNYPVVKHRYDQHLNHNKSYHKDWGDGYDIYHVGSSAGVGSEALWVDGRMEAMETWVEQKILKQSKELVEFELKYERTIEGKVYNQIKKISLALGSQLFHAESTFFVDGELAKNLPIAIAVATHDEKAEVTFNKKAGYIATWERLNDNFGIGTAVLVDPKIIGKKKVILSEGVKDAGHALYVVNTDDTGKISYYSGFAWQRAGIITSKQQWLEYLAGFNQKK